MNISASLVKELRERTSAGMMECKKALVECNGDIDAAAEQMRKAGMAKADKKADRIAAEGRIVISITPDNKSATILEVNCETDFVSKGDDFGNYAQNVANVAIKSNASDAEALLSVSLGNETVDEARRALIAKVGENINVRRLKTIKTVGVANGYTHGGGKIGVVISATCDDSIRDKAVDLMKNVAMHACAMNPKVIHFKDLDSLFVKNENEAIRAEIEKGNDELVRLGKPLKRIPDYVSRYQLTDEVLANVASGMKAELKAQGKPEEICDKIVAGQMARYILDNTQLDQEHALLSQAFVMDDKKTVAEAIAEVHPSITIVDYVRFELGDGIEKKIDNFVEEVMAQAKGL